MLSSTFVKQQFCTGYFFVPVSSITTVSPSAAAPTASAEPAATTASSTVATAAASLTALPWGLGSVHLDGLTVDLAPVQLGDGLFGTILVGHGHEGVALASVVNVIHLATSVKRITILSCG